MRPAVTGGREPRPTRETAMSLTVLEPPAVEPLTVGELKLFLKIDDDAEDELIADIARAARRHVEDVTGKLLITQRWRIRRDAWPPSGRLALPFGPVQSLDAVTVTGPSGAVAVDIARFVLDGASAPPRLAYEPGSLPAPAVPVAGISLDVTAGFGGPADVPDPILQALRLVTGHWLENRSLLSVGHEAAVLPRMVEALLAPFVTRRL
jgi:uncharacterized phiE125 gp8 family phage protein